jgi:hypothetical protein
MTVKDIAKNKKSADCCRLLADTFPTFYRLTPDSPPTVSRLAAVPHPTHTRTTPDQHPTFCRLAPDSFPTFCRLPHINDYFLQRPKRAIMFPFVLFRALLCPTVPNCAQTDLYLLDPLVYLSRDSVQDSWLKGAHSYTIHTTCMLYPCTIHEVYMRALEKGLVVTIFCLGRQLQPTHNNVLAWRQALQTHLKTSAF